MNNPNRIWPVRVAQVVRPLPEGALSVTLEDAHYLGEVTVRVARARAHPAAGEYRLPEVGDWGVVAFTRDDMRTGVWLGALDDIFRNLVPQEVWAEDARADLTHHPGDQWALEHGDGTTERHWPDGSHLRLSTGKDGSTSNAGLRGAVTERMGSRKTGPGESERQAYAGASRPPVDVEFQHSSGAIVRITADGTFQLHTPAGHRMELRDGTEKQRDPDTGEVTGTPEEDANRVVSGVELRSEAGSVILLNDDPVNLADRFVRVQTPAGHLLELRDLPVVRASVATPGGREVLLDDDGGVTRLTDPARIEVDAPEVLLGDGGGHQPVARVGDAVQVNVVGGSSAGAHTGTITAGSGKVDSS